MRLICLRHPATVISAEVCYGRTDVPCEASAQAAFVSHWAHQLMQHRAEPVAAIYCSPLLRCKVPAQQLAQRLGLTLQEDSRLMEADFGRWEGQRWNAIGREAIDAWVADFAHHAPGGGESVADVLARVASWVLATQQYTPSRSGAAVLVTHAGVIAALAWLAQHGLSYLSRLPRADEWPPVRVAHGESWALDWPPDPPE
jgi:alpha-ribazole phosphatase